MRERFSRPLITNAGRPRRPVGRADQSHLIRRESRRRRVVEGGKRSPVVGSRRHPRSVRYHACHHSRSDLPNLPSPPPDGCTDPGYLSRRCTDPGYLGRRCTDTARTVLIGVVLMVVVAGLGVQTIVARADEVGLVDEVGLEEAAGLQVRGTGAADGLTDRTVDIEVPDLGWGLTVDFRRLTQDLGVDPALLADDVDEREMDAALDAALDMVASETGFRLDEWDELSRLHDELEAVQRAVGGYLAGNPVDTDRSTLMVKDILDTMLPLMGPQAPCGAACDSHGMMHIVAIDDILQAVDFALDPVLVGDETTIGTEAAMIGLQCLIPAAVIILDRWRALEPQQQRDFLSLGVFTALNNAVSLLSRGATTGIDALGGAHAFAAETTRMAQAIVDSDVVGVPAMGIAAIDIRDQAA